MPIAKRASQVERGTEPEEASLAMGSAYAKLERRMTHRLDSLALLLLLPLRGE
jgi:biopolymer transport protein ExbB/TolQ